MILFRFAWVIFLVIMGGHALTSCLATSTKAFPEDGWPRMQLILPAWLHQPTLALDVIWVRGQLRASEVRDGVCILHLADNSELDLRPADSMVRACASTGRLRTDRPTPPGGVRVYWHQVPDRAALVKRYQELHAGLANAMPFNGFYYHPQPSGVCHVVTATAYAVLGHEIKHCFDGRFHGEGNRWRERRSQ